MSSTTTATLSVEELKKKSAHADELIEKLKKQIAEIKMSTTPAYVAEKSKTLQQENEVLRKQVDELKKELEQVELKNKSNKPTQPQQPSQAKEGKKQATPAKKDDAAAAPKDVNVSILDIRIGKIVEVDKHPEADKLYVEKIDFGEGKLRTVCSGLVQFIPLEQMQNKMVVCVCNLKPAKLKGVMSEAMVLCASTPEKVELVVPPESAQIGDRISVEGFEGKPADECTTKNNFWGLVQPDLSTNETLVATYKGVPLEIKGKGICKSSTLKNVPVK